MKVKTLKFKVQDLLLNILLLKFIHKGFNKHDRVSLPMIFFDSSKPETSLGYSLVRLSESDESENSPASGGFRQSRLLSLQFAKNCYRKISDVAQSVHVCRCFFVLTAYFSLLIFSGCGYTIHSKSSLPFDSIQIGNLENLTVEPKLQDRLHEALTEEFLKQGINVYPDALFKLSGRIYKFELIILSQKQDIATEYEVIIEGDFRLVDSSGNIKDFKKIGSPFIVSFQSSDLLEDVLSLKELASERAIRDMAMEIVSLLIYQ
jgi:hypothetical protein